MQAPTRSLKKNNDSVLVQITPQVNSKSKLCLPAQTDGWTMPQALIDTVRQLSAESLCFSSTPMQQQPIWGTRFEAAKKEAGGRREV